MSNNNTKRFRNFIEPEDDSSEETAIKSTKNVNLPETAMDKIMGSLNRLDLLGNIVSAKVRDPTKYADATVQSIMITTEETEQKKK